MARAGLARGPRSVYRGPRKEFFVWVVTLVSTRAGSQSDSWSRPSFGVTRLGEADAARAVCGTASHRPREGPMPFVAIILDRSGSMDALRDDAIGGFNTLLEDQKTKAGDSRLLLVQFDDQYEIVFDAVPIAEVPPLTRATFVPRGQTALLDAIGRTIADVEARLGRLSAEERPASVLIAVITDGEENASREYSATVVRDRITACRAELGWEFLFLGTSAASVEESQSWGIDPRSTGQFSATAMGLRLAFRTV